MANGYNGWANYETWNFMLWHGDTLEEMISEYKEGLDEDEELDYGRIHVMVNGYIDNEIENMPELDGFLSDVIGKSIQQIDIHEITSNLIEEE